MSPHVLMKGMQNSMAILKTVWQVFTKSGTHPSKMKTYVDISVWTQILIGFICNCQNLKAI